MPGFEGFLQQHHHECSEGIEKGAQNHIHQNRLRLQPSAQRNMLQNQHHFREYQCPDQHRRDAAETDLVVFKDKDLQYHEGTQPGREKKRYQGNGLDLVFQFFMRTHDDSYECEMDEIKPLRTSTV